jgi:hypothetical protein
MKSVFALGLAVALSAPVLAENVFVREASVGKKTSAFRDVLTKSVRDTVRDAVRTRPSDQMVATEEAADVVLVPRLRGTEGNYTFRIERHDRGVPVASVEVEAGSPDELAPVSSRATSAILNGDEPAQPMASSAEPQTSGSSGSRDSIEGGGSRSGSSLTASEARRRPAIAGLFGNGRFTFGLGPSFGSGMNADNIMYGGAAGYVWDLTPRFAAKVIGEADIGSGRDNGRFLDLAAGGDFYLDDARFIESTRPYVTADVGVGSARNQASDSQIGIVAGVGAGLRIASSFAQTMDIGVNYKLLTTTVAGANPSVLGLRASVNF